MNRQEHDLFKACYGFLITMEREIYNEDSRQSVPNFYFRLERTMSIYMQQRYVNSPSKSHTEEEPFFYDHIFPTVKKFCESRTQEEEDWIFSQIWKGIIERVTSGFAFQLQVAKTRRYHVA